jgi:ArsR family transcriptional regulator, arsenate/arsenite/antimonite-responsive transcriptional repressor
MLYISLYDEIWEVGMRAAIRVLGALSDENRLRLLYALRHGELCVCQLIDLMGLSPSTVSKHLSILRDAGLLDSRKAGRWVYYRLADAPALPIVGKKAAPIFQSLEKAPVLQADDTRLKKIRGENMEDLCRRLFRKQGTR